ncbi:MAG TPA: phospho-N-acetylmuramoyl-pentapeptide-transferase [Acidimicrobiales bacterium]|nr:phospho-N-acetylmuramoyl-pentapeptide-transferase [Acidimicrobiales bacterium]
MIAILVAGGTALLVALVGTPVLIGWLHREGIGQQIREDGPQGHVTKAGTPTMGGIALVGAAVVGYLAGHLRIGAVTTRSGLLAMFAVVGAGLIGLADDWIKVSRQRSLGLNKRAKSIAQLVLAIGFGWLGLHWAGISTNLSFTRYNNPGIHLGEWGWMAWAVLMIVGASNAVNLTDGLDGLAAGAATFSFSTFVIIGYWEFRHYPIYHVHHGLDLALVAVALAGACAGFLWWNAAPARIFMGDTGSLAIGAGLAALALEMNLQLLLPVLGGLFVIITLSVVIQVVSFRLFHRRVFRMAPLHHHFELAGWPETTVIVRFWILAGLCTAIALGAFYADFLRFGRVD